MVNLETCVRAFGDMPFQRLQQIIQMHYSSYTDNILDELQQLLNDVPSYVEKWEDPLIIPDMYRIYGRKSPANKAITSFVNAMKTKYPQEELKERKQLMSR